MGSTSHTQGNYDADLVRSGQEKQRAGKKLTHRERDALKRHEKDQLDQLRDAAIRKVPKSDWNGWAERSSKVVNDHADRFGIPLRGRAVDVTKVAKALHDLLASGRFVCDDQDPLLAGGGNSPALEGYREERRKHARLDRLQAEKELMWACDVKQRLDMVARVIRNVGGELRKKCGDEAAEILEQALEDVEREIAAMQPGPELYGDDPPD